MDQPSSTSRHILVVLCVIVVFTAVVLVALNAWMKQGGNPINLVDRYQQGYVQGYTDARDHLRAIGLLMMPSQTLMLSGTVVSVGTDSLVVKQTSLDTVPAIDKVPDERNVLVTSSTKIYRRTNKDPEVLARELRAFQLESQNNPGALPPDGFTKTDLKLSDIADGTKVVITSGADLRLLSDITATEVIVVE